MASDQVKPTVVIEGPATAADQATIPVTQLSPIDPTEATAKVAESLQATLVELIDLSLQAKQAHWNLLGPSFKPIYLLLDELNDEYRDWYDELAERLAASGVAADGRIATVSAGTPLEPHRDSVPRTRGGLQAARSSPRHRNDSLRRLLDGAHLIESGRGLESLAEELQRNKLRGRRDDRHDKTGPFPAANRLLIDAFEQTLLLEAGPYPFAFAPFGLVPNRGKPARTLGLCSR